VLWDVFLALHSQRGGGLGPAPISCADVLAYQQLHGVELTPWEVDSLRALDSVALKAASEQSKTKPRT
jgi:hypothetical protein